MFGIKHAPFRSLKKIRLELSTKYISTPSCTERAPDSLFANEKPRLFLHRSMTLFFMPADVQKYRVCIISLSDLKI